MIFKNSNYQTAVGTFIRPHGIQNRSVNKVYHHDTGEVMRARKYRTYLLFHQGSKQSAY